MGYLILPIVSLVYFELLGRLVNKMMGLQIHKSNMVFGFVTLIAVTYIAFFIPVYFRCNFKVVFIIFLILIAISIILFFKYKIYKTINIDIKYFSILIVLFILLTLASSYYFIGNLNTYDTVSYSNLVSSNIYQDRLNTYDLENGFLGGGIINYAYQSFYTLASCFVYVWNIICTAIDKNILLFTQYIWFYTVIYYALFCELFVKITKLNRNKIFKLTIFLFIFVFIGCWYLYLPHIGNSFRIIVYSYILYYTKCYFETKEEKSLDVVLLLLLSTCGMASCDAAIMSVYIFAIWFINKNTKKDILKYCAFLIVPLTNVYICVSNYDFAIFAFLEISTIALMLFVLLIYYKNLKIKNIKHIKGILLLLIIMVLIFLSYKETGNLWNFESYYTRWIDNGTGWSFFNFRNIWTGIVNVFLFAIGAYYLISTRNEKLTKVLLIILLLIFSPFTTEFIKSKFIVYQRFLEIIINPFSMFLMLDFGYRKIIRLNSKIFKYLIIAIVLLFGIFVSYNEFTKNEIVIRNDKPEGYNFWLKMTNNEADALKHAKSYMNSNDLSHSYVASSILQLRSEVPTVKTLFNRRGITDKNDEYNNMLLEMIYPDVNYYAEYYNPDNYDYDELMNLFEKTGISFVIQSKKKTYHDKETDTYYPLTLFINKYVNPIYENDDFALYDLRSVQ